MTKGSERFHIAMAALCGAVLVLFTPTIGAKQAATGEPPVLSSKEVAEIRVQTVENLKDAQAHVESARKARAKNELMGTRAGGKDSRYVAEAQDRADRFQGVLDKIDGKDTDLALASRLAQAEAEAFNCKEALRLAEERLVKIQKQIAERAKARKEKEAGEEPK